MLLTQSRRLESYALTFGVLVEELANRFVVLNKGK